MEFSNIRNYLFLALLTIASILFLSLLKPFAYVIFWAAVLAAIFYPFYRRLNAKLDHANLSALIILILILLIIILPVAIIGTLLVSQSLDVYSSIANNGQLGTWIQEVAGWLRHNPITERLQIDDAFWIQKFSEMAQFLTGWFLNFASAITQNSVKFFALFFMMVYALFFFVRDGEKFLRSIMHLCPLGDKYEKQLYDKFVATAGATLKGGLIVAVVQGTLGGVMFALAGIPAPIIWGVIMTVLSMIPGIGSFLIWLPAGIVMIILGHIFIGVSIILFGALVISTIDNFLRPILIGKSVALHPLIIFFSTLGGLVVFGPSGFVAGPIIAALFVAFWDMYEEYYRTELNKN
ncbi:MAG: hypothetical protein A2538_01765 [Candidatus Magasanikbacteria bacterium RIFOXYD2_FULL_41_14]|uniref:AI-2E family transporter n=1 Tax=Candidatus Magasanikbacteria bacterium RIFOXYD2_FULL_41_14 TaxID=1798709 RepID=A0A1F6PEA6_9BACT|nr:MAG: hypothetical protein A2538_01765 [Candidatus Magasanikbacteria bacterium RIFOXYD2_FULL_41_14]